MKNIEWIRQLSPEDLAKFFIETDLSVCDCPARKICERPTSSCEEAFIEWLEAER